MKKLTFFTVTVSMLLSSCVFFQIIDIIDATSDRNSENDIRGNVKIYIENKSREIIVVHNHGYGLGVELARISVNDLQIINIRRGSIVYVMYARTGDKIREIKCDEDQKHYIIY